MRNPQVYVSGKRPIVVFINTSIRIALTEASSVMLSMESSVDIMKMANFTAVSVDTPSENNNYWNSLNYVSANENLAAVKYKALCYILVKTLFIVI